MSLTTGLTGKLSSFDGDLFYSHQENRVDVNDPQNTNNARYMAAQDAVIAPAGTTVNGVNVAGTIQCWDVTQPQFAALYAGCVPINTFDPVNGITQAAYNYMKSDTFWALTQKLDNIGGSISGGVGFGLPAGEITGALSGEMRWRTYDLKSNADADGLCELHGPAHVHAQWRRGARAVDPECQCAGQCHDNVWETALEINVPLLKDVPLAQDLNTDIAGRYTRLFHFRRGRDLEDRCQ